MIYMETHIIDFKKYELTPEEVNLLLNLNHYDREKDRHIRFRVFRLLQDQGLVVFTGKDDTPSLTSLGVILKSRIINNSNK